MSTSAPADPAASSIPAPSHRENGGRDKALVEAARRGEEEAWKHIYDHLGERLTRYAASRGITDAEDVTQDVMYAAAQRIDRFDGDWENLRSWLFNIAYRRCADHHRRRARSPEQLTHLPPEDPDFDTCADGRLWAEGEAREVFSALAILDDREREVVTLRVIEEMTTREVADATGLSRSNVRVIQSRSLAKLRRYLEANGGYLDKRFRTIVPPVVAVLEKLRLLRRLGVRAEVWLNKARFWSPVDRLPGSAAVTGGLPHALAAGMIATAVAAGGLNAATPAEMATDAPHHPEPPAVAPAEGGEIHHYYDGSEGDSSEGGPAAGDSTNRQPAADILPAVVSAPSPPLGTGRGGGSVTDLEPLSQLSAAVDEKEGSPVGTDLVREVTGGTAVETTTPDVVEAAEAVADDESAGSDDDIVHFAEADEAPTQFADDAVAELADEEPDSLLDG